MEFNTYVIDIKYEFMLILAKIYEFLFSFFQVGASFQEHLNISEEKRNVEETSSPTRTDELQLTDTEIRIKHFQL